MSLYSDAVELSLVIDHQDGDLYLLDSPAARWLVINHKLRPVLRRGTGARKWLELPFLYDPYWHKLRKESDGNQAHHRND